MEHTDVAVDRFTTLSLASPGSIRWSIANDCLPLWFSVLSSPSIFQLGSEADAVKDPPPSIPPEKLLRAQLIQMLYSVRSGVWFGGAKGIEDWVTLPRSAAELENTVGGPDAAKIPSKRQINQPSSGGWRSCQSVAIW